jgi:hypothetical protein
MRPLALLFLLLPLNLFAQEHLGKSRTEVVSSLKKFVANNPSMEPKLNETDSTIDLTVKDPKFLTTSFSYTFDSTGTCVIEKVRSACDACRGYWLKAVLDKKDYDWKKINGNQYISKFTNQVLIEIPIEDKDYTFMMFKAQWSKEMYDMLINH